MKKKKLKKLLKQTYKELLALRKANNGPHAQWPTHYDCRCAPQPGLPLGVTCDVVWEDGFNGDVDTPDIDIAERAAG